MIKGVKWFSLAAVALITLGVVAWTVYMLNQAEDKTSQVRTDAPIVEQPVVANNNPQTETNSAVTMPVPVKISIPKIQVETTVESVGQDSSGRMDVPKDFRNVGWYNLGFRPGDMGGAVMAGHLDTVSGKQAVFYNLNKLAVGDEIKVTGEDGKEQTFVVTEKKSYKTNEFPMEQVFNNTGSQVLALITCNGTFDRAIRNYTERLVVYSKLKA